MRRTRRPSFANKVRKIKRQVRTFERLMAMSQPEEERKASDVLAKYSNMSSKDNIKSGRGATIGDEVLEKVVENPMIGTAKKLGCGARFMLLLECFVKSSKIILQLDQKEKYSHKLQRIVMVGLIFVGILMSGIVIVFDSYVAADDPLLHTNRTVFDSSLNSTTWEQSWSWDKFKRSKSFGVILTDLFTGLAFFVCLVLALLLPIIDELTKILAIFLGFLWINLVYFIRGGGMLIPGGAKIGLVNVFLIAGLFTTDYVWIKVFWIALSIVNHIVIFISELALFSHNQNQIKLHYASLWGDQSTHNVSFFYTWGALFIPMYSLLVGYFLATFLEVMWLKKIASTQAEAIDLMKDVPAQEAALINAEVKVRGVTEDGRPMIPVVKSVTNISQKDLKILRLIGKGGSNSWVYKCKWLGKVVAFKCFKENQLSSKDSSFSEFETECAIMARVKHPHICAFYGVCVERQRVGIVMEYCDNGDLKQFLQKYKGNHDEKFSTDEKMRIMCELSSSMRYLHGEGIIHRDIKPENLLLTNTQSCKIVDFGISRKIKEANVDATMTSRIGTSIYMAPEVVLVKADYDQKCDVYSFGMMLFVVLTENWRPFGDSITQVELQAAMNPDFRPNLEELHKIDTPQYIIDIIVSCWDHDPEQRKDFNELFEIFNAVVEETHQTVFVKREGIDAKTLKLKLPKIDFSALGDGDEGFDEAVKNTLPSPLVRKGSCLRIRALKRQAGGVWSSRSSQDDVEQVLDDVEMKIMKNRVGDLDEENEKVVKEAIVIEVSTPEQEEELTEDGSLSMMTSIEQVVEEYEEKNSKLMERIKELERLLLDEKTKNGEVIVGSKKNEVEIEIEEVKKEEVGESESDGEVELDGLGNAKMIESDGDNTSSEEESSRSGEEEDDDREETEDEEEPGASVEMEENMNLNAHTGKVEEFKQKSVPDTPLKRESDETVEMKKEEDNDEETEPVKVAPVEEDQDSEKKERIEKLKVDEKKGVEQQQQDDEKKGKIIDELQQDDENNGEENVVQQQELEDEKKGEENVKKQDDQCEVEDNEEKIDESRIPDPDSENEKEINTVRNITEESPESPEVVSMIDSKEGEASADDDLGNSRETQAEESETEDKEPSCEEDD